MHAKHFNEPKTNNCLEFIWITIIIIIQIKSKHKLKYKPFKTQIDELLQIKI